MIHETPDAAWRCWGGERLMAGGAALHLLLAGAWLFCWERENNLLQVYTHMAVWARANVCWLEKLVPKSI